MRGVSILSGFVAGACALSIPQRRDSTNDGHRLIEYVQTFHTPSGQNLSLLPLLEQNTRITHVNLAAIHIDSTPGEIHLNDDNPNSTIFDQTWSDVATLQKNGIKVLFMIGGAAGGSYENLCGSDVPATVQEQYYEPLYYTIKYHNIDGVDLDIEEAIDISCALALTKRFRADFGADFIQSMAPVASALYPNEDGLSGFSYTEFDSQAVDSDGSKLVNYYNAQFYNGFGDASSTTDYDNIISQGAWDPARISVGALDNVHDGGSGYVHLADLQKVIVALTAKYPSFGGVTGWEYYDAGASEGEAQPWQWVKNVAAALYDGSTTVSRKRGEVEAAPAPKVPWEAEHRVLVKNGASHFEAVKALNRTAGDLPAAKKMLKLEI